MCDLGIRNIVQHDNLLFMYLSKVFHKKTDNKDPDKNFKEAFQVPFCNSVVHF